MVITRMTSTNISALFRYKGHTLYADAANLAEMNAWMKPTTPPVEVMIFKTRKRDHEPIGMGNPLYEAYYDDVEKDFNAHTLLKEINEFCKLADRGMPKGALS